MFQDNDVKIHVHIVRQRFETWIYPRDLPKCGSKYLTSIFRFRKKGASPNV